MRNCRGQVVALALCMTSAARGKVLVVGGSGALGKQVVAQLHSRSTPHRVLVRKLPESQAESTTSTEYVQGDLLDPESLATATEGCSAIIAVSGTSKFTTLGDVLTGRLFRSAPPADVPDHPGNVNYVGMENLCSAALSAGTVRKIVRVTGLTQGLSPFHPVSLLFGSLLSVSGRWHALGERAIRRSGLDYTILRPGGLADGGREGRRRMLRRGSLPPPGRIGRGDVAALCLECLSHPAARSATFACAWAPAAEEDGAGGGGGADDGWAQLLAEAAAEEPLEVDKSGGGGALPPHRAAALAALLSLASTTVVALRGAVALVFAGARQSLVWRWSPVGPAAVLIAAYLRGLTLDTGKMKGP